MEGEILCINYYNYSFYKFEELSELSFEISVDKFWPGVMYELSHLKELPLQKHDYWKQKCDFY